MPSTITTSSSLNSEVFSSEIMMMMKDVNICLATNHHDGSASLATVTEECIEIITFQLESVIQDINQGTQKNDGGDSMEYH
eukprot:10950093-Ditylum_brightwellii.AAC.1